MKIFAFPFLLCVVIQSLSLQAATQTNPLKDFDFSTFAVPGKEKEYHCLFCCKRNQKGQLYCFRGLAAFSVHLKHCKEYWNGRLKKECRNRSRVTKSGLRRSKPKKAEIRNHAERSTRDKEEGTGHLAILAQEAAHQQQLQQAYQQQRYWLQQQQEAAYQQQLYWLQQQAMYQQQQAASSGNSRLPADENNHIVNL